MAGLKRQQAASRKELTRLRAAAERTGGAPAAAEEEGSAPSAAAPAGAPSGGAADDAAAAFGAAFLQKSHAAAAQPEAAVAAAGGEISEEAEIAELEERAEGYQSAVEKAWAEVQRMEDARQQMDARFEATREETAILDREKEEMEATLHEVADPRPPPRPQPMDPLCRVGRAASSHSPAPTPPSPDH